MKRLRRACMVALATLTILNGCRDEHAQPKPTPVSRRPTMSASPAKAWLQDVKSVPPQSIRLTATDTVRTRSGMFTRLIRKGSGERHPTSDDAVVLYSQVYDAKGRVVASGQQLIGDPRRDLNQNGQEAIYMMVQGEVRRFWFPNPKLHGDYRVTDYELVWISPRP